MTPGFIDLHTHLDAQVGWDPLLKPLTYHGVTTALIGNCGVTFAPCRPADHALLAGMMESVEDIPRAAILDGLPWDWESYGEYLDSVTRLRPAINLAGMVGHSAVRFYVMGERAIDSHPDAQETDAIAALVGQSVRDGAFGCSINRLHQLYSRPDPDFQSSGFVTRVDHPETGPTWLPGRPWRFSATASSPVFAAPCVGQHSREILAAELAIGDAEYEQLVAAGVTGTLDDL